MSNKCILSTTLRPKTVSVYSNIGVGEAYLERAGLPVSVACELCEKRCDVYHSIYRGTDVVCGDVTLPRTRAEFVNKAKGAWLMIATPPCQGFSTLNPKGSDDPRNNLVEHTFGLIQSIQPSYALLENVPQMLRPFGGAQGFALCVQDQLPNYQVTIRIVDAADFGTPQSRKRAIALFSKTGNQVWEHPAPAGGKITLRTAIGDLPSLESGECSERHPLHYARRHSPNHVEWLRHTPTGRSAFGNTEHYPHVTEGGRKRVIKAFANSYKRMEWEKPAPTFIQGAHMISSSNTVHPGRPLGGGKYSDARTLSPLEAMRVMGLPDDWPLPRTLPYNQAISYLGEGFCPKVVLSLVNNITRNR
jgi:DNA (cytosine-5)-methyltransferase 1